MNVGDQFSQDEVNADNAVIKAVITGHKLEMMTQIVNSYQYVLLHPQNVYIYYKYDKYVFFKHFVIEYAQRVCLANT